MLFRLTNERESNIKIQKTETEVPDSTKVPASDLER
jgi:hypothetical protein